MYPIKIIVLLKVYLWTKHFYLSFSFFFKVLVQAVFTLHWFPWNFLYDALLVHIEHFCIKSRICWYIQLFYGISSNFFLLFFSADFCSFLALDSVFSTDFSSCLVLISWLQPLLSAFWLLPPSGRDKRFHSPGQMAHLYFQHIYILVQTFYTYSTHPGKWANGSFIFWSLQLIHILVQIFSTYFTPWAKGKMAHLNFHLYLFGSKQANSHPTWWKRNHL